MHRADTVRRKASRSCFHPGIVLQHLYHIAAFDPTAHTILESGHCEGLVELYQDFCRPVSHRRIDGLPIAVNHKSGRALRFRRTGRIVIARLHRQLRCRQILGADGPERLIQVSLMLYLHGFHRLHRRTVQVFINYRNLIPYHTVIHIYLIGEVTICGESYRLTYGLSAGNRAPGNLITQHILRRYPFALQNEVHMIGIAAINSDYNVIPHGFHSTRSAQAAGSALKGVRPGVIIYIVDCPGLLLELLCIGAGLLVGRHPPALKEIQQVLLCCSTGQADQVLILLPRQLQCHAAGLRRFCRIPGIRVHPGEEQIGQLFLIILIGLEIIASVIRQMKLPVHPQLREHIRCSPLRS